MSQINSNTKDDFQVVLLLSCFVGHPVQGVVQFSASQSAWAIYFYLGFQYTVTRVSSEKGKSFRENVAFFTKNFFLPKISNFFALFPREKCEIFCFFRELCFNLFREKMRYFSEIRNSKISRKSNCEHF